jgi:hypothetical protein
MINKLSYLFLISAILLSCGGYSFIILNVNDKTPVPKISAEGAFVLQGYSKEKRYGTEKSYPINVFYGTSKNDTLNVQRFMKALVGPHGEHLRYTKIKTCCPFTSKHSDMGVGLLDQYEVTWPNQKKPMLLYFNNYEKGELLVPVGLRLK